MAERFRLVLCLRLRFFGPMLDFLVILCHVCSCRFVVVSMHCYIVIAQLFLNVNNFTFMHICMHSLFTFLQIFTLFYFFKI